MSQEEYLGPQRGRTALGELPYAYPKTTKEYRTLPLTPQFKDESPAGNQHLRYVSPTHPDRAAHLMWDLVVIDGGGGAFQCWSPRIILSRSTVSSAATITGNSFTPAVGDWVFVKINHAGTTSIESEDTWTGFPDVYEISEGSMTWARIPLWEFVAVDTTGAIPITEDVWAKRYVGTGALRSVRTSYYESTEYGLVMTLDLI